jgi:hypothetical protein
MNAAKLDDAKVAAIEFVDAMDLGAGGDQVAVVRFDAKAEMVVGLTRDRAAITASVEGLAAREWTHIDKGLRVALGELGSERRVPANLAVMVLLTDGVQTGMPGEELAAAAEVRAAEVMLYGIGLGAAVDPDTLVAMTGDAGRYRYAPDSRALAAIYREIAWDIHSTARLRGTSITLQTTSGRLAGRAGR